MKLQDVKDLEKDDLLALLGLQTKMPESARLLGALSIFGVGLLVGAGAALLLAPKPGRQLRDDIRSKLQQSASDGESTIGAV
jgi:gas vesicle protein